VKRVVAFAVLSLVSQLVAAQQAVTLRFVDYKTGKPIHRHFVEWDVAQERDERSRSRVEGVNQDDKGWAGYDSASSIDSGALDGLVA